MILLNGIVYKLNLWNEEGILVHEEFKRIKNSNN